MQDSTHRILPGLLLLSVCSLLLGLRYGSVALSWTHFFEGFHVDSSEITRSILWDLRGPRVLNAYFTGGLLALSGALLQVLLRNPLADPFILGVSGGAAIAELLGLLLGLSLHWLSCVAFLGALFSMLLLFSLAYRCQHGSTLRILLTGTVLGSGWGALISLILSLSSEHQLPALLFWLLGDLNDASLQSLSGCTLLLGFILSIYLAPALNLLGSGELRAESLGVSTRRLSIILYFLSALLTAVAVVNAGTIGFVGLIVPHSLRLLGIRDHQRLLPGVILLGGSLLVLADTLARTVIAPLQLPVGVLTALLGVPVFLFLLSRNNTL